MSRTEKPKHIRAVRGRVARRIAMPPVVNLKSWTGDDQVPVAVLDVSDPDALIEQAAEAIAERFRSMEGVECSPRPFLPYAAAVLESLGLRDAAHRLPSATHNPTTHESPSAQKHY